MSTEECLKKLDELGKYVPFLENMITRLKTLKTAEDKPREAQVVKMEALHKMLTDRKKRLRLETINRCEGVLLKLYNKVEQKMEESCPLVPDTRPASNMKPLQEELPCVKSLPKPTDGLLAIPQVSQKPSLRELPGSKMLMCKTPPFSLTNAKAAPPAVVDSTNATLTNARDRLLGSAEHSNTPRSPSPPRTMKPIFQTKPVVIPTEKVPERVPEKRPSQHENEAQSNSHFSIDTWNNPYLSDLEANKKGPVKDRLGFKPTPQNNVPFYWDPPNVYRDSHSAELTEPVKIHPPHNPNTVWNKPRGTDLYSKAGESIFNNNRDHKPEQSVNVFDRLGYKPIISVEDLRDLLPPEPDEAPEPAQEEQMELQELEDLRHKLQNKLSKIDKKVEKKSSPPKLPKPETIVTQKPKNVIVNVIKEQGNMFASALCSIDEKILDQKVRKKSTETKDTKKDCKDKVLDGDVADKKEQKKSDTKDNKEQQKVDKKNVKDKKGEHVTLKENKSESSKHRSVSKEKEKKPTDVKVKKTDAENPHATEKKSDSAKSDAKQNKDKKSDSSKSDSKDSAVKDKKTESSKAVRRESRDKKSAESGKEDEKKPSQSKVVDAKERKERKSLESSNSESKEKKTESSKGDTKSNKEKKAESSKHDSSLKDNKKNDSTKQKEEKKETKEHKKDHKERRKSTAKSGDSECSNTKHISNNKKGASKEDLPGAVALESVSASQICDKPVQANPTILDLAAKAVTDFLKSQDAAANKSVAATDKANSSENIVQSKLTEVKNSDSSIDPLKISLPERLAVKYNPRPRKQSIEQPIKPLEPPPFPNASLICMNEPSATSACQKSSSPPKDPRVKTQPHLVNSAKPPAQTNNVNVHNNPTPVPPPHQAPRPPWAVSNFKQQHNPTGFPQQRFGPQNCPINRPQGNFPPNQSNVVPPYKSPNNNFMGNRTPVDPFLIGNSTPSDPFLNKANAFGMSPTDAYMRSPAAHMGGNTTPGDPFLNTSPCMRTPGDPFMSPDSQHGGIGPPVKKFANTCRPNQHPAGPFPNVTHVQPLFKHQQASREAPANFRGFNPYLDQNDSPNEYDLSKVQPLDFYDGNNAANNPAGFFPANNFAPGGGFSGGRGSRGGFYNRGAYSNRGAYESWKRKESAFNHGESYRKHREEKERREREERERFEQIEKDKQKRLELERAEKALEEKKKELEQLEQKRLERLEKDRLERIERDRFQQIEKERLEQLEKERLEQFEKERLENIELGKKAAEEKQILEEENARLTTAEASSALSVPGVMEPLQLPPPIIIPGAIKNELAVKEELLSPKHDANHAEIEATPHARLPAIEKNVEAAQISAQNAVEIKEKPSENKMFSRTFASASTFAQDFSYNPVNFQQPLFFAPNLPKIIASSDRSGALSPKINIGKILSDEVKHSVEGNATFPASATVVDEEKAAISTSTFSFNFKTLDKYSASIDEPSSSSGPTEDAKPANKCKKKSKDSDSEDEDDDIPLEKQILNTVLQQVKKMDKKDLIRFLASFVGGEDVPTDEKKQFKRIKRKIQSDSESDEDTSLSRKSKVSTEVKETAEAKVETLKEVIVPQKVEEEITAKHQTPEKVTESVVPPIENLAEVEESTNAAGSTLEPDSQEEPEPVVQKKPRKKPVRRTVYGTKKKKPANKKAAAAAQQSVAEPINEAVSENVTETTNVVQDEHSEAESKDGSPVAKTAKVKKAKRRGDLEMLQEDIKNMFISNGVVTATGKRMCSQLKEKNLSDDDEKSTTKSTTSEKAGEEETALYESPTRSLRNKEVVYSIAAAGKMRQIKVLLEKADLSKVQAKVNEASANRKATRRSQKIADDSTDTESVSSEMSTTSRVARKKMFTPPSAATKRLRNKKKAKVVLESSLANESDAYSTCTESESLYTLNSTSESSIDLRPLRRLKTPRLISKATYNTKRRRVNSWAKGYILRKRKAKSFFGFTPDEARPVTTSTSEATSGETSEALSQASSVKSVEPVQPPPPCKKAADVAPPPPSKKAADVACYHERSHHWENSMKRMRCKLCHFMGRQIVQHYRTTHVDSEVFISRLEPEITAQAIATSKAKNLEALEATHDESGKFEYKCRFCDEKQTNVESELFYDHLTQHTGEFRFNCGFCTYKTISFKSLKGHVYVGHPGNHEYVNAYAPEVTSPPNFRIVFGYLCAECHYIQLQRSNLEKHIATYHEDSLVDIIRIDMSQNYNEDDESADEVLAQIAKEEKALKGVKTKKTKADLGKRKRGKVEAAIKEDEDTKANAETCTPKVDVDSLKLAEEQESTPKEAIKMKVESASGKGKKLSQVKAEDATAAPPKPKKAFSRELAALQLDEAIRKKEAEIRKAMDLPKPVVETPTKERDANIFELPPEYIESERKIEEERLKRMKEINANLKPSRKTSLSMADRLKNRLENSAAEEKSCDEANSHVERGAMAKAVKKQVTKKTAALKVSPQPAPPPPCTSPLVQAKTIEELEPLLPKAKPNLPVMNVIEKLKKHIEDSPKLKPLMAAETPVSLTIGPITIVKKSGHVTNYVCNINVCVFATDRSETFLTHCRRTHKEYLWAGDCPECSTKIEGYPMGVTMFQTFQHIVRCHLPEDVRAGLEEKLAAVDQEHECPFKVKLEPVSPQKGVLRLRKLSGDNLSTACVSKIEDDTESDADTIPIEDAVAAHQKEEVLSQEEGVMVTTDLCDDTEAEEEEENFFPFSIANVRTITDEAELEKPSPGDEVTPTTSMLNLCLPLIPFNSLPTREVIRESAPSSRPYTVTTRKLFLKVHPMTAAEMVKPRKSCVAMAKLLLYENVIALYKCPYFTCEFATAKHCEFEAHINSAHAEFLATEVDKDGTVKPVHVPCLYCNNNVALDMYLTHLEVYHGQCTVQCGYCLYRAFSRKHVHYHHEEMHPAEPEKVYNILAHEHYKLKTKIVLPALKKVVPPFRCTKLTDGKPCEKKFIYADDFNFHLTDQHRPSYPCNICVATYRVLCATPVELIQHLGDHGLCLYHCRYCQHGCMEIDDIRRHQAKSHSGLPTSIIVRLFKPSTRYPLSLALSIQNQLHHLCAIEGDISPGEVPLKPWRFRRVSYATTVDDAKPVESGPPPLVLQSGYALTSQVAGDSASEAVVSSSGLPLSGSQSPMNSSTTAAATATVQRSEADTTSASTVARRSTRPKNQSPSPLKKLKPASPLVATIKTVIQTDKTTNDSPTPGKKHEIIVLPRPTQVIHTEETEMVTVDLSDDEESQTSMTDGGLTAADMLADASARKMLDEMDPLLLNTDIFGDVDPLSMDDDLPDNLFDDDVLENEAVKAAGVLDSANDGGRLDKAMQDVEAAQAKDQGADDAAALASLNQSLNSSIVGGGLNLSGMDLFRCCHCFEAFPSSGALKEHVNVCVPLLGPKPFKCYHCSMAVRNATSLIEHYRKHGEPKFECSLCQLRYHNISTIRNHMRDQHKVINVTTQRIGGEVPNVDADIFIAKPVSKHWKQKRASTDSTGGLCSAASSSGGGGSSADGQEDGAAKTVFLPSEIASVPRQAIFSMEMRCATCEYRTKVRTNFVRHLEFHQKDIAVPQTCPVNPVPCLEKNEKMFDKMINLAFASNVGTSRMGGTAGKESAGKTAEAAKAAPPPAAVVEKFVLSQEDIDCAPAYVEARNRYVCGASTCNYLTHDDSMLRNHLQTLHTVEDEYVCVHCRAQLANDRGGVNVDYVLKHLKLHDLQLYKCAHCTFYHNQRGKVDHHLAVKHADCTPYVHVVRDMEEDKVAKSGGRPWKCGICKARFSNRDHIIEHCSSTHSMKSQFKCALCSYQCGSSANLPAHFEDKHPGLVPEENVIPVYFREGEQHTLMSSNKSPTKAASGGADTGDGTAQDSAQEPFDTTPLWQRNKPRVKHIRGILFDYEHHKNSSSPLKLMTVPAQPPPPPPAPVAPQETAHAFVGAAKSYGGMTNLDKAIEAVATNTGATSVIQVVDTDDDEEDDDDDQALSLLVPVTPTKKSQAGRRPQYKALQKTPSKQSTAGRKKVGTAWGRGSTALMPAKTPKRSFACATDDDTGIDTSPTKSSPEKKSRKQNTATPAAGKSSSDHLSPGELAAIENDVLLQDKSMGEYGPYGAPFNRQFLCPLCVDFKTKKSLEITHHLYRELKYMRFQCNKCPFQSITYKMMHKHSSKKHGEWSSEDICSMPIDTGIEKWVQKVLMVQKRLMNKNTSSAAGSTVTLASDDSTAPAPSSAIDDDDDVIMIKEETPIVELDDDDEDDVPLLDRSMEKPVLEDQTAVIPVPAAPLDPEDEEERLVIDEGPPVLEMAMPVDSEELAEDSQPSTDEAADRADKEAVEATVVFKCKYCTYQTRHSGDIKKHERRHYIQKPLKCGRCDFEGVTSFEISSHSKRKHPGMEVEVVAVPMPSKPNIKQLKSTRKRKMPMSAGSDVSSSSGVSPTRRPRVTTSEYKTAAASTKDGGDTSAGEVSSTDPLLERTDILVEDYVYICSFCPKRSDSVDKLKKHFEETHMLNKRFIFKTFKKGEEPKTGPRPVTKDLKCEYCDLEGDQAVLQKHHEQAHPNRPFRVYRFKCAECDVSFKQNFSFTAHYKLKHPTLTPCTKQEKMKAAAAALSRTTATNSAAVAASSTVTTAPLIVAPFGNIMSEVKMICEYCLVACDDREALIIHHKELHSHLDLRLVDVPPPTMPNNLLAQPLTASGGAAEEIRTYKCPSCDHSSNSYNAMRDHLRGHVRPYRCGYCSHSYNYPSLVKTHQRREHPDMEYKHIQLQDMNKMLSELRENLLIYSPLLATYVVSHGSKTLAGKRKRKSTIDNSSQKYVALDIASSTDEDLAIPTKAAPAVAAPERRRRTVVQKPTARKSTATPVVRPQAQILTQLPPDPDDLDDDDDDEEDEEDENDEEDKEIEFLGAKMLVTSEQYEQMKRSGHGAQGT